MLSIDEIAQISEENRLYLKARKKPHDAAGNHARRLQRLQEILDELVALTDWKKVGTRLQEAACLLVIP